MGKKALCPIPGFPSGPVLTLLSITRSPKAFYAVKNTRSAGIESTVIPPLLNIKIKDGVRDSTKGDECQGGLQNDPTHLRHAYALEGGELVNIKGGVRGRVKEDAWLGAASGTTPALLKS